MIELNAPMPEDMQKILDQEIAFSASNNENK